jgi:hypothetical protein
VDRTAFAKGKTDFTFDLTFAQSRKFPDKKVLKRFRYLDTRDGNPNIVLVLLLRASKVVVVISVIIIIITITSLYCTRLN